MTALLVPSHANSVSGVGLMVKEMLHPIAVGLMLKVIPPRDDGVGVRAEHKKSPQGSICSPGGGF